MISRLAALHSGQLSGCSMSNKLIDKHFRGRAPRVPSSKSEVPGWGFA
jgi:hypothetical protein